jgi:hypothetical protein
MIHLDTIFSEPLLEFGNGGESYDIREGILKYGPMDVHGPKAKTTIKLGFVGTPKTIHAFSDWMKKCSEGFGSDNILNQKF